MTKTKIFLIVSVLAATIIALIIYYQKNKKVQPIKATNQTVIDKLPAGTTYNSTNPNGLVYTDAPVGTKIGQDQSGWPLAVVGPGGVLLSGPGLTKPKLGS